MNRFDLFISYNIFMQPASFFQCDYKKLLRFRPPNLVPEINIQALEKKIILQFITVILNVIF